MITSSAETRLTVADPRSPARPSHARIADVRNPASASLVLLATAILALALAGRATAAPPCAEAILADWHHDGRVDQLYDLRCYEAAINAIPDDIRPYIDAEDAIRRAFQSAAHRQLAITTKPRSEGTTPRPVPPVVTSSPTAIPIPLLVLGGMSVVLLAAGGLGYLSRRRRQQHSHETPGGEGAT